MGSQSSSTKNLQTHHKKFLKVFKNNYKLSTTLKKDSIFGQANLYQNINNNTIQVIQKSLSFPHQYSHYHYHTNTEQPHSSNTHNFTSILSTMQSRITQPHPNLIRIYSIEHLETHNFCSTTHEIKIYTEYLEKNLKNQLQKRRKNGAFLSQELLMKIMVSLINGIGYLHGQGVFHGEIRTETVLVDGGYHLRMVERAILGDADWRVVVEKGIGNGVGMKILRGKGVLLSPCILECLREKTTQMANYDPFKADIFAIGMILLECCSLKKSDDLYNFSDLTLNQSQISSIVYDCRRKYSHKLMNFVQKMLQFDDDDRPTAKILLDQMQIVSGDTIRQMNTTLNQSFLSQSIKAYM